MEYSHTNVYVIVIIMNCPVVKCKLPLCCESSSAKSSVGRAANFDALSGGGVNAWYLDQRRHQGAIAQTRTLWPFISSSVLFWALCTDSLLPRANVIAIVLSIRNQDVNCVIHPATNCNLIKTSKHNSITNLNFYNLIFYCCFYKHSTLFYLKALCFWYIKSVSIFFYSVFSDSF